MTLKLNVLVAGTYGLSLSAQGIKGDTETETFAKEPNYAKLSQSERNRLLNRN